MFRKKNKKGWLRILEATIAVLMVSGVLVFVYSRQPDSGTDSVEYFYNLQTELLSDISYNSELRLNVLNADDTNPNEGNYSALNDYVQNQVIDIVGFYISICDLDSQDDFCNMNTETFRATREKDVFVQDIIIAADLGTGGGTEVYQPRMLRLFMWEN
jgi:hypothetical protein